MIKLNQTQLAEVFEHHYINKDKMIDPNDPSTSKNDTELVKEKIEKGKQEQSVSTVLVQVTSKHAEMEKGWGDTLTRQAQNLQDIESLKKQLSEAGVDEEDISSEVRVQMKRLNLKTESRKDDNNSEGPMEETKIDEYDDEDMPVLPPGVPPGWVPIEMTMGA